MHPMIEKYGKQTISELLDMIVIKKNISNEDWRHFLLKHGIIKQTTKRIKGYVNPIIVSHEYVDTPGSIIRTRRALAQPYIRHIIYCKNGRGTQVFKVQYTSIELPQIMEELQ